MCAHVLVAEDDDQQAEFIRRLPVREGHGASVLAHCADHGCGLRAVTAVIMVVIAAICFVLTSRSVLKRASPCTDPVGALYTALAVGGGRERQ